LLIKACLNGSREPGEHPSLPASAHDLAHEAQLAVAVGAGALHIHPRRADGVQSLAVQDQADAVIAIRAQCPGIPVGVSTGLWIEPDVQRRLQLVREWTVLPDFASVNFSEPGTAELCALLFERGIGVEVGIGTIEDALLLLHLNIADRCVRILIEPEEPETAAALAQVETIIQCLDEGKIRCPRLLHGQDATAWPVLEKALQLGYDTRIGLEDTLTLPGGRLAQNNAELVAFAYQRARQNGRIL
jgi:uncharacterized protein (DUF849 family)